MSDNSERTKHAETIIRNHVIWSMGAGMIPILVADVFAVSALQLDMIRQLSMPRATGKEPCSLANC